MKHSGLEPRADFGFVDFVDERGQRRLDPEEACFDGLFDIGESFFVEGCQLLPKEWLMGIGLLDFDNGFHDFFPFGLVVVPDWLVVECEQAEGFEDVGGGAVEEFEVDGAGDELEAVEVVDGEEGHDLEEHVSGEMRDALAREVGDFQVRRLLLQSERTRDPSPEGRLGGRTLLVVRIAHGVFLNLFV